MLPFQLLVAAFMLLLGFFVRNVWPEGQGIFQNLMVSGTVCDQAESVAAALENLEDGDTFTEAISVFCQEIFHGK